MRFLSSTQILAAVRRSLETHVLPEVSDDFARVQIAAALKALEEVGDRFENGDPCERSNARLEAGLREIARNARGASPDFAAGLEAVLETPSSGEPRERARRLGEAIAAFLGRSDASATRQVLQFLHDEAAESTAEDTRWACHEALQSLG
jgi:hypothetical protein